jgi:hypothetical protein
VTHFWRGVHFGRLRDEGRRGLQEMSRRYSKRWLVMLSAVSLEKLKNWQN